MNNQEVSIRPATLDDIDSLLPLLKELFSIEEDFVFNETKQRKGLVKLLSSEKGRVMVATINNEVVGMCSIQTLISTAEGGIVGLIEDMVIKKKYSGRGIGKTLLASIEKWGKLQGMTRLQLLADKNNVPALKFYEKCGWQKTQLICLRKFT
jgi:ribosomal protein S18 acetylase RimI-like enzyme